VALTMHTLDRRDQAWLLRRLLPGVRATLRSLLRELRGLGFSQHLDALAVDLPAAVENPELNQDEVSTIDQANPGVVAALVMRQPDMVQRALLHARPWRWRAAVWEQAGPIRRSLLLEPLPVSAMPVCKLNALLFGFVRLLRAEKARGEKEVEGDQP
jgi:hypothetical protein